jgi:hypothetical protein
MFVEKFGSLSVVTDNWGNKIVMSYRTVIGLYDANRRTYYESGTFYSNTTARHKSHARHMCNYERLASVDDETLKGASDLLSLFSPAMRAYLEGGR